jgi:hypothetical protein
MQHGRENQRKDFSKEESTDQGVRSSRDKGALVDGAEFGFVPFLDYFTPDSLSSYAGLSLQR